MIKVEKEWVTEAGYPAQVVAHPMGHRCGYVTVPESHPCYGVYYIDCLPVAVHGGLTFGEDGKFGFDCAHYDDAPDPALVNKRYTQVIRHVLDDGIIRTLEFCIAECESMARQFKALEEKHDGH